MRGERARGEIYKAVCLMFHAARTIELCFSITLKRIITEFLAKEPEYFFCIEVVCKKLIPSLRVCIIYKWINFAISLNCIRSNFIIRDPKSNQVAGNRMMVSIMVDNVAARSLLISQHPIR